MNKVRKSLVALAVVFSCLAVGAPAGSTAAMVAPAAPTQVMAWDGIWFVSIHRCLGYCGPINSWWCPCSIYEF